MQSAYFENGKWQSGWFGVTTNPGSLKAVPGQNVFALWSRLLARRTPAHELKRVLDPKLHRFRIQFAGSSPDRGPSILTEVEIEVMDVSAAIIAAANIAWPPRTIGLRILDSEGREASAERRSIADRRDSSRKERRPREGADDGVNLSPAANHRPTAFSTLPTCAQAYPIKRQRARRERRHPKASINGRARP